MVTSKSKSKKKNAQEQDDQNKILNVNEDVMVTSKSKSKKKTAQEQDDQNKNLNVIEDVMVTSKRKSKKSGRTQEQDDQNKILSELVAGLPTPEPTTLPREEKACVQYEPLGSSSMGKENKDEAETGESAGSKKKWKKVREKGLKAEASAAVTTIKLKDEKQEETVSTVSSKEKVWVPKHVIEKQKELARRKEAEERKKKEKEEKLRKEEEELEKQRQAARRMKKDSKIEKYLRRKQERKLLPGRQKEEARRLEAERNQYQVNYIVTESADKGRPDCQRKKASSAPALEYNMERVPLSKKSEENNLRSPICCIMGHVDTGKTKLLDCLRGTNVQEGEAGGITQQIGATFFPAENIRARTKELKADAHLRVPGLLVIDTPGHECFKNLRSRGAAFCDIAILVVDIMHGLEPQTIECLNLLTSLETKFIIALNKVDRLYGWKTCSNAPIGKAMKQQSKNVKDEFETKLTQIITQFKEQGLNTELYYRNEDMEETFSIVPTSAISGEGVPDLLLLSIQWTQRSMADELIFREKVKCTVLEVKTVEGLGTTIDVVLYNGVLHEGDQIVVCGVQEPIVTTIRALMTPRPMMELRVKSTYLRHKELKASQCIRISAQGLEDAIAGTCLYVVGPDDDVDIIKKESMKEATKGMMSVMSKIDRSREGVCVQASTLGSLEALLEHLTSPEVNIPVRDMSIGPIHKRDVMKASAMLDRKKEYAAILAFDVKVTPEARKLADNVGVEIFVADVIYHLFDQFKAHYIKNVKKEEEKKEAEEEAVFPCVLRILPGCVVNKKNPIVVGVEVLKGIAMVGTPICIPRKFEVVDIGRIASMQVEHTQVNVAKTGQEVTIKICSSSVEEQQKMLGKHFQIDEDLVSHITRKSIDTLKANHRGDMSKDEWKLITKLKATFNIQ